MLKKILCISGKPGLYELLRYNKNMVIVENLSDKKRGPVFASERIISLGDIAIYTTSEEVPLASVLEAIKDKNNAQPVDLSEVKTNEQLAALMADVLPNYDTDRVHPNDITSSLKESASQTRISERNSTILSHEFPHEQSLAQ